jgi:hypothetical protein
MTTLNTVYIKSLDVVYRKIADEFVLVPIRQKAVDLKSIFTLNEPGAFIWEQLDGSNSILQIKEKLMEEYDVESPEAESDTTDILSQLENLSFIKKA